ncbi:MAG: potassium transporter TrkG, partial [Thermodesulfobacteriota bacterium]
MPLQAIFRKLLARPSDKPYSEVIRYRIVLKYLGVVLLVLGAESAITAAVSFEMAEHVFSYIFYLVMAVMYSVAGLYLFYRVPEKEITVPEVAAVAASSFLVASLLGAAPFAVLGAMPPVDAWFESMSGFTTTGFSLMDVQNSPSSLIFMRALSQWLGGMGFVVITVSILLVSRSTAV